MDIKKTIRMALGYLCFYSGGVKLIQTILPRKGALILYGHRVAYEDHGMIKGIPPDLFEKQIRYLSQHYHFISLSQLVAYIRNDEPVPHNSLVLTFDDGFRDNYTYAFPILQKYDVKATIFLVVNCLQDGSLPWPQCVEYLLNNTKLEYITVDTPVEQAFNLRTTAERLYAIKHLKELRKTLPLTEHQLVIDSLEKACGLDNPRNMMLTWEQIKEMREWGIEFGAHTLSHPLMAYIQPSEAYHEMVESKRILEEQMGEPVHHFVFPGGSYTTELNQMVQDIGYSSVFVRKQKKQVNDCQTNPFALRRVGLSDEPVPVVATEISGFFHWLR